MKIKGLIDEDFVNYRKVSMFISFPYCTFKCDKENGCQLCQNMPLVNDPTFDISMDKIIKRYLSNDISKAFVLGGLEPLDSFKEVYEFILLLRKTYNCDDEVVIYTGYNKEEIDDYISLLKKYKNIIIKFGRFRPNQQAHYDEVLGIKLISDNQYAEKIS
jgi:organic radical activating enzyme